MSIPVILECSWERWLNFRGEVFPSVGRSSLGEEREQLEVPREAAVDCPVPEQHNVAALPPPTEPPTGSKPVPFVLCCYRWSSARPEKQRGCLEIGGEAKLCSGGRQQAWAVGSVPRKTGWLGEVKYTEGCGWNFSESVRWKPCPCFLTLAGRLLGIEQNIWSLSEVW